MLNTRKSRRRTQNPNQTLDLSLGSCKHALDSISFLKGSYDDGLKLRLSVPSSIVVMMSAVQQWLRRQVRMCVQDIAQDGHDSIFTRSQPYPSALLTMRPGFWHTPSPELGSCPPRPQNYFSLATFTMSSQLPIVMAPW